MGFGIEGGLGFQAGYGLGFRRVEGLKGSGIRGLGFRVKGVQDLRFRVQKGVGVSVQG